MIMEKTCVGRASLNRGLTQLKSGLIKVQNDYLTLINYKKIKIYSFNILVSLTLTFQIKKKLIICKCDFLVLLFFVSESFIKKNILYSMIQIMYGNKTKYQSKHKCR